MSALLQIERLSVRFGSHEVVRNLSLTLAAGEKLALVGESGSGKTQLALRLLGDAAAASQRGMRP